MKNNLLEQMSKGGDKKILTFDPKAKLNIIWFTYDGIGFPIAHRLMMEKNNVILAQVKNKSDLNEKDDEDKEVKRRRLSVYDGLIDKRDAADVLKAMKGIENKDEWIIFFDFNNMGVLAEKALDMGFTKGLFPTTKHTELEADRNKAKEIVKEHYKGLTLGEVHEFTKVADGVKFLTETDRLWVLKGNSDNEGAKTIVPYGEDPETAKMVLTDALEAHQKDYEHGGFILEEKIVDGYEATPQIVFLDGVPVMTDLDIECKPIGCGNVSVQTGAMHSLVTKITLNDKIAKAAFPQWIFDQAKDHPGLFIADAGIIFKKGKLYFTEFCFNRFGFDSIFAELEMSGSATDFFLNLFKGRDPLKKKFGAATRGLNLHKDGKERRVLEGVSMSDPDAHTWIFECKKDEDKYVCTGCGWDLVVFTGAADDMEDAAHMAYLSADVFAFEDLYLRPEFDFMSDEYASSIPNRYDELKGTLFTP